MHGNSQGTINMLLPFVFTIYHNQKGRYQIAPLSVSDHQSGERRIDRTSAWIHPASSNAEERRSFVSTYKQHKAAHVFVQAVSIHSGGADSPAPTLKIEQCQMSDIPVSLVHMTEFRHLKSIFQNGLLCQGGNTSETKLRNMNHFLPIDALLLSQEHNSSNCQRGPCPL